PLVAGISDGPRPFGIITGIAGIITGIAGIADIDMAHFTDTLTALLAFAFMLGVIIVVHEAGHLMVAKAFGVRVLTFSVGFGRRIWGFRRGETDYRVSLVPLGGYVRLGGETPDEVTNDPREFLNKPRWQRILV